MNQPSKSSDPNKVVESMIEKAERRIMIKVQVISLLILMFFFFSELCHVFYDKNNQ